VWGWLVDEGGNDKARRMAGLFAGMMVQAKAAFSGFYDTGVGGLRGMALFKIDVYQCVG